MGLCGRRRIVPMAGCMLRGARMGRLSCGRLGWGGMGFGGREGDFGGGREGWGDGGERSLSGTMGTGGLKMGAADEGIRTATYPVHVLDISERCVASSFQSIVAITQHPLPHLSLASHVPNTTPMQPGNPQTAEKAIHLTCASMPPAEIISPAHRRTNIPLTSAPPKMNSTATNSFNGGWDSCSLSAEHDGAAAAAAVTADTDTDTD